MMSAPKAIRLLPLIALLFLANVRAALQFDMHPGYESKIREAAWFPITFEIHNDGASFNAIIEVSGGQFGGEQVRQVPIELPTATRKRVVVPMFASGSSRFAGQETWTARLLDPNGKPIRAIEPRVGQTRIMPLDSVLMGALPRNYGGSPVFPEMKGNRQELKPEVARITVDQFPDNPLTLEGLNAFYLSSEKAPDLKVNQITALLAWIRAGGHLIIGLEQISDINGTPWLKQFLPMELSDARNVPIDQPITHWLQGTQPAGEAAQPSRRPRRSLPPSSAAYDVPVDNSFSGAELLAGTGQIKDGDVLFSSDGVPLAVQAPRGRGKITLLTFSPEREPFRSWKGRESFWAKLAGIPPEYFIVRDNAGWGGISVDGVFGALIDSRQIKKLPVTWLLLLLVAYLVVIGPFDQWWLKKIGRQMLTWITFPTYVVLFSLLIYFIGYKLRAGETEWNELNIVDIFPRGEQVDLRGRTYVSIYSSGNATYPINGQQGHAALRPELSDFRGGPNNERLRVVQQGNTFEADVFVPVWTSLLYSSEWFKTNDIPFLASVTRSGAGFQIEIENFLDRPLTQLRLVAGGKLFEVADIPPATRKLIHIDSTTGVDVKQFVRENSGYFQHAVQTRRSALGDTAGGRLDDRPLTAITASLLSYTDDQARRTFISPPGLDLRPQVDRGDAVIFAWMPNFSLAGKINDFQPPRFQQDTLLRLTLPVR